MFVPQQEAWVVERFGKFHRLLEPVSEFEMYVISLLQQIEQAMNRYISRLCGFTFRI